MHQAMVINPKTSQLGDGFSVRRSLPRAQKRMVGPFIFWDHMGPVCLKDGPVKIAAHPHVGLATMTYLFSGEILHRDSLGYEQLIQPGDVNWMVAGEGIAHSETLGVNGQTTLNGIQLWIALPNEHEHVAPSFSHYPANSLPTFVHSGARLNLIAGEVLGYRSPVPIYSPLFYVMGTIPAHRRFSVPVGSSFEGALYLVDGRVTVGNCQLDACKMVVFPMGQDIIFESETEATFMLLGGQVFDDPPYIWWNFVSSSEVTLERAKKRWKEGHFPAVINETERVSLPSQ